MIDSFQKNKLLNNFKDFFSGELFSFLSTFLSGYFYALYLGPSIYGTWQTAKIFINFSIIFSLSLPFVMRRDYIWLRSQGKYEEADKLSRLVLTYQLVITPIFSTTLILYSIFFIKDHIFKFALIAVGIIYFTQVISGFGNILAKGLNNYKIIRNASYITGILTILTIPIVKNFGIYSLFLSSIIISLILSFYYIESKIIHFRFYWNKQLFFKTVFIAFPLYVQDISTTVFELVDRTIIASKLSFKDVGLYSLSTTFNLPLKLLLSSLSIVLFTHLNEHYGEKISYHSKKMHVDLPRNIISWIFPPIVGLIIIIIPFLTDVFLPKYELGIKSAQISIVSTFFYLLSNFTSNGLFIISKQKISAIIFLSVSILNTILCFLFLKFNTGIIGVSLSTLISYLSFDFFMLIVLDNFFKIKIYNTLSNYISNYLPLIYVLITIIFFNLYLDDKILNITSNNYKFYFLKIVFYIFFLIPFYIFNLKYLKKFLILLS